MVRDDMTLRVMSFERQKFHGVVTVVESRLAELEAAELEVKRMRQVNARLVRDNQRLAQRLAALERVAQWGCR